MNRSVDWYELHADEVIERYESLAFERVHGWHRDSLPDPPTTVLDIGAGSGRDAAWLARRGHEVVAIEPSAAMRERAQILHRSSPVSWMDDRLPGLARITRSGLSFDAILLSAVWMHIPAGERARAFRKIINLLRPGGMLVISLRLGAADPERGIHPVSVAELVQLCRDHGAFIEKTTEKDDALGRKGVQWTHVLIRLPNDGTGALPLLRHIILNDNKSSTYKLALLSSLSRIADRSGGMAHAVDDDFVAVPLGLVGLTWIRLFKPLLRSSLPQSPTNVGYSRLDFVKEPFRRLDGLSHHDLRIGMQIDGDFAEALHQALRDAVSTICRMPARYLTYPGGEPILKCIKRRVLRAVPQPCRQDAPYLSSFGEMLVPIALWQALQRFAVWIEPALVAEWAKLMHEYAHTQGRSLDPVAVHQAMLWADPTRDVGRAREFAMVLLDKKPIYCVWTGRKLKPSTLDIDHGFPWSAWPCNDMWNLLPAHQQVNRHQKRQKIPSDRILLIAEERITDWWQHGYLEQGEHIASRFTREASASLPGLGGESAVEPDDVFAAMRLQRSALRMNQQIPEWEIPKDPCSAGPTRKRRLPM